jgi:hypothetical protein
MKPFYFWLFLIIELLVVWLMLYLEYRGNQNDDTNFFKFLWDKIRANPVSCGMLISFVHYFCDHFYHFSIWMNLVVYVYERAKIHFLYKSGFSINQIHKKLKYSKSTIIVLHLHLMKE